MRLRLFGPLRFEQGSADSAPSASKIKTILATLAIGIGGLAGTEDLAEELWADMPRRVAPTVQTYIFRTRRFLQEASSVEGGLITTTHRGYQLDLDRIAVDVLEFDRLVEDGVNHLEADRAERAILSLGQALTLSVDAPMPDVAAGPKISEKMAWLKQRRDIAEHTMWDARLRVNDHSSLIHELSDKQSSRPLDEGVAARLMYALDAVGRPQDATAVYRRLCGRLDRDLGLGPSQRLENMHDSLLAGRLQFDGHVRRSHTNPSGAVLLGRSAKRPSEAIHGRASELADLQSKVDVAAPLILAGSRGIGKTAVAMSLSWSAREHFPEGQFVIDVGAARSVSPHGVATQVARDLMTRMGETSTQMAPYEFVAALRSWASSHSAVFVLDGVSSTDEIAPLIPQRSASAFIVTAQRRLVGVDNARVHVLAPLPDRDIEAILEGKLGSSWISDDPEAGATVVRMCRGLPALAVAAVVWARRCGLDATDFATELADPATRWTWIQTVLPALADMAEGQLSEIGSKLPRIGDDGAFPRVALDHLALGRSLRDFVVEETESESVVRLSPVATYRHLAAS